MPTVYVINGMVHPKLARVNMAHLTQLHQAPTVNGRGSNDSLSVFLFFYLHSECLNLNPSGGIKILSSYTYCHKEDKIRIKTLMKMQWTRTHTQTDRCVISSDCVVRRLCDIPRAKNRHRCHPQSLCIEQNNGSFKHRTQTDEHRLH